MKGEYKKGFDRAVRLAKASVEYVRKDGYNDIDYVLEVFEKKIKAEVPRG